LKNKNGNSDLLGLLILIGIIVALVGVAFQAYSKGYADCAKLCNKQAFERGYMTREIGDYSKVTYKWKEQGEKGGS
jgi:hypothetical protein